MIVDARAANRLFKDAPGVQMCTADGFSHFEVEAAQVYGDSRM